MVRKYVKFVDLQHNEGQYRCTTMLRASHALHRSDITVEMETPYKDVFILNRKYRWLGVIGTLKSCFLLPAFVWSEQLHL
jgi:hypothetical protein